MTSVPPDLAAKVHAADLRNVVKSVGEGGTLSPSNRQTFLTFEVQGDPDAMRDARETALLQKWLSAGRLSKEERAEIEHILPSSAPASVTTMPSAAPAAELPKANGYARTADDYGHLGIARRTFFRWKSAGESNAEGPDPPPFDDPQQLEQWYERMRARGVFKHRFPKDVRTAIAAYLQASPPPATRPASAASSSFGSTPPNGSLVPDAFNHDHGQALGLHFELQAEEKRVASLRVARDQCYAKQDLVNGDSYDRRYREALESLSLLHQRHLKIAEQEARLVPVEMIEREFAPKISAVVSGGMLLYDRVAVALGIPAELIAPGRAIWKRAWIEHCTSLVEGRFAPPLNLESLAA